MTRPLPRSVFLWVLRIVIFAALAYGLGFLAGYFTDLPAERVGLFISVGFVLYLTWREKRVNTANSKMESH